MLIGVTLMGTLVTGSVTAVTQRKRIHRRYQEKSKEWSRLPQSEQEYRRVPSPPHPADTAVPAVTIGMMGGALTALIWILLQIKFPAYF